MAPKLVVLQLACLALLFTVANGKKFTLHANNLPAKDVDGGAPDTYINVYYTPSATAPYQLLGRTKAVADSKGPEFAEIYEIPEGGESDEALKFDIFDADTPDDGGLDDGDDYIGYVWTRISSIHGGTGGVWTKNIHGTGGNLYVTTIL